MTPSSCWTVPRNSSTVMMILMLRMAMMVMLVMMRTVADAHYDDHNGAMVTNLAFYAFSRMYKFANAIKNAAFGSLVTYDILAAVY